MDATIDTTTQDKGSLCKVGALAGLGAGIATGVIGAVASAIDVPLNVGGNEVPVGAFFGSPSSPGRASPRYWPARSSTPPGRSQRSQSSSRCSRWVGR